MASSYGEDASSGALRSAYTSVHVLSRLSPSHRNRILFSITQHLHDFRAYREAPLVLGYVPQREEFDCLPVLERVRADGKDVALPIFDKATHRPAFAVVTRLRGFVRGATGMLEPDPVSSRVIPPGLGLSASICLVPGLVFDAQGYRVAYGAGWWDAFLRTYPGMTIGLASEMQVSGNPLPHGVHDVALDALITESVVWMCRR